MQQHFRHNSLALRFIGAMAEGKRSSNDSREKFIRSSRYRVSADEEPTLEQHWKERRKINFRENIFRDNFRTRRSGIFTIITSYSSLSLWNRRKRFLVSDRNACNCYVKTRVNLKPISRPGKSKPRTNIAANTFPPTRCIGEKGFKCDWLIKYLLGRRNSLLASTNPSWVLGERYCGVVKFLLWAHHHEEIESTVRAGDTARRYAIVESFNGRT